MKTRFFTKVIMLGFCSLCQLSVAQGSPAHILLELVPECPKLQTASLTNLASFLDTVTDVKQNSPCIAFAIQKLGNQRYEPAVPVLINCLGAGPALQPHLVPRSGCPSLRDFRRLGIPTLRIKRFS